MKIHSHDQGRQMAPKNGPRLKLNRDTDNNLENLTLIHQRRYGQLQMSACHILQPIIGSRRVMKWGPFTRGLIEPYYTNKLDHREDKV